MIDRTRIDYEKLPSDDLENLLRCDCLEPERAFLSLEEIFRICKILAQRRHLEDPEEVTDLKKRWEELLKFNLDEDTE